MSLVNASYDYQNAMITKTIKNPNNHKTNWKHNEQNPFIPTLPFIRYENYNALRGLRGSTTLSTVF